MCILPSRLAEVKEQEETSPVVAKMRVLYVEDQRFNQKIVREMLERLNLEVYTADNGKDAFYIYRRNPEGYFEFILTDLNMPIMDGKDFIMATRELEYEFCRKRIPIVVLSGNTSDSEKDLCIKLGADYFWSKPLKIDKVKKMLISEKRKKKKIMIVDDDPICLEIMKKFIESGEFMHEAFLSPNEALNAIKKAHSNYALLITDCNMPEMDGYDLSKSIKEFESNCINCKPLPILCLSGYDDNSHKKKLEEAGIRASLLKPVHKKALLDTIHSIVKP